MVRHHRVLEIEMISGKQRNRSGDTRDRSNHAQPSHRQIQKRSGAQSQKVLDPNRDPKLTRHLAQQPQEHWISRRHPEIAVYRPSANPGIARRIRVKQNRGEVGQHQNRSNQNAERNQDEEWPVAKILQLLG